jgi:hypothetical protein
MNVVPATRQHVMDVQLWLSFRGQRPWPLWMFDTHGYAVDGLAVVWMYVTGPFALIELLCGNPAADAGQRDQALDAVAAAALADAKRMGVRAVFVTTTLRAVAERASKFGFQTIHTQASMLVADLGGA